MLFGGSVPVVDGEFGTTVKTGKTESAVVLDPDRLSVLHFDSVYRTVFCTETASDAGIFQMEIGGQSCVRKGGIRRGFKI